MKHDDVSDKKTLMVIMTNYIVMMILYKLMVMITNGRET